MIFPKQRRRNGVLTFQIGFNCWETLSKSGARFLTSPAPETFVDIYNGNAKFALKTKGTALGFRIDPSKTQWFYDFPQTAEA